MKTKLIICAFVWISSLALAQSEYAKVYAYDDYNKGWAMVKTNAGTFGFINKDKKIVVQPIYSKIEKNGDFILVKNVSDVYGLLDKSGKEVTPAIYEKIWPFGEQHKDWAMVKNRSGQYGYIAKNGKEVVPAKFTLEELKTNYKFIKK